MWYPFLTFILLDTWETGFWQEHIEIIRFFLTSNYFGFVKDTIAPETLDTAATIKSEENQQARHKPGFFIV
jgi:hypothetical protein